MHTQPKQQEGTALMLYTVPWHGKLAIADSGVAKAEALSLYESCMLQTSRSEAWRCTTRMP